MPRSPSPPPPLLARRSASRRPAATRLLRRGSMVLTMATLAFRPGSFQPRDLVPALAPRAENVTGSVGLAGSIAWRDGTLAPNLLLRFDDLAFSTDAAQVRALKGAIKVTRLWPPATAPHQTLSATITAPGLPP